MKAYDKSAFAKLKATVTKSGNVVATAVQSLIEMGLDYYVQHGDSSALSEAVNTAAGAKSVKANDVKAYVTAHANVRWVEGAEGQAGRFKKIGKAEATITEPTKTWYEFTKQSAVTPDLDVASALATLTNKLAKALNGEGKAKLKEGQNDAAAAAVAMLTTMQEQLQAQGLLTIKA